MSLRNLLLLNHAFLFLCTSMYLGTGWSLLLFSFPIADQLTPDNYYMQFVPQVDAATQFFTYMTIAMGIAALVMIISEWKKGRGRWLPVIVLVAIVAATLLTTQFILPYNDEMREGIAEAGRLHEILGKWMTLNRVRVSLWTIQWGSMMIFFAIRLTDLGKSSPNPQTA